MARTSLPGWLNSLHDAGFLFRRGHPGSGEAAWMLAARFVIHAPRNPSQETERRAEKQAAATRSRRTQRTPWCWRFCWWTNTSPVNPSKSRDAGPCPLHQDPGLSGRTGTGHPDWTLAGSVGSTEWTAVRQFRPMCSPHLQRCSDRRREPAGCHGDRKAFNGWADV